MKLDLNLYTRQLVFHILVGIRWLGIVALVCRGDVVPIRVCRDVSIFEAALKGCTEFRWGTLRLGVLDSDCSHVHFENEAMTIEQIYAMILPCWHSLGQQTWSQHNSIRSSISSIASHAVKPVDHHSQARRSAVACWNMSLPIDQSRPSTAFAEQMRSHGTKPLEQVIVVMHARKYSTGVSQVQYLARG